MRKVKTWGRKRPDVPPEVRGERQPPRRMLRLTSRGRSDVARMLFPELSPMEAGNKVAHDIMSDMELHVAMMASGYRRNAVNYTPQQVAILMRYYGKASFPLTTR